jgi:hypothetical protein
MIHRFFIFQALKSHQTNLSKRLKKKGNVPAKNEKMSLFNLNLIDSKLEQKAEAKPKSTRVLSLSDSKKMSFKPVDKEKAIRKEKIRIQEEIYQFQTNHKHFNNNMKAYIDVCLNNEDNLVSKTSG